MNAAGSALAGAVVGGIAVFAGGSTVVWGDKESSRGDRGSGIALDSEKILERQDGEGKSSAEENNVDGPWSLSLPVAVSIGSFAGVLATICTLKLQRWVSNRDALVREDKRKVRERAPLEEERPPQESSIPNLQYSFVDETCPQPSRYDLEIADVVAGHSSKLDSYFSFRCIKLGIFLKRIPDNRKGKAEIEFYKRIATEQHDVDVTDFLPKFFGTAESVGIDVRQHYCCLEDLEAGFVRPSTIDIKLGMSSSAPDASPEKRARERGKWPPQACLGFRVLGIRTYNCSTDSFDRKSGGFGKSLSFDDAMLNALIAFLFDGNSLRRDVLPSLCRQVSDLLRWIQGQAAFEFYGSSIVLIYDGHPGSTASPRVGFVDFANWREQQPGSIQNKSCAEGLHRILESLRALRIAGDLCEDIARHT